MKPVGIRMITILVLLFNGALIVRAQEPSVMGMLVGAGYGKLKTNDISDKNFAFKPAYTKMAGISLEIPLQKMEKKGSVFNELTFSQFEAKSLTQTADSSLGHPERDYFQVDQVFAPNLITIGNMFRYCFTNSDFKYYVSLGIYNSFVISPVNRKTSNHSLNGETTSIVEDVVPDHSVHGLMLILGTGVAYKYAGLEFRFDPGRNYTRKVDYSVYNPNLEVILHVRFNP